MSAVHQNDDIFDSTAIDACIQDLTSKMDPLNPLSGLNQDSMPEIYENFIKHSDAETCLVEMELWGFLRDRYGWAVPTKDSLDKIASENQSGRVIEIGAGSGYVTKSLHMRGVDIIGTNAHHINPRWTNTWQAFCNTIQIGAKDLEYHADAYIMIFPDCANNGDEHDMMLDVLTRIPNGKRIYLCAPDSTGSIAGKTYLQNNFKFIESYETLNPYPDTERDDILKLYVKQT